ncbi:hypothetical protein [Pedobacter aquatilis]|uniref:hypothetical protein n=1 Tax=Pedobacter aquatilis TaxID=351343 RepID=UPI00292FB77F|nr:hypothetical protein [Pedobacter aquatilis]
MAKAKGTPKTGGRAKGTINKKTAAIQASLELVMNALEGTILDDLDKVNPSRRLQLYTDLMNYVKPKLSATKNENDTKLSGGFDVNFTFDLDNIKGIEDED